MAHVVKEFRLEGKLDGISDNQIQQHRDILYKGYVDRLNLIEEKLKSADRAGANPTYSEIGELKRQEIFATNGIYLHEAYFGNLGGKGTKPAGKIAELINRDFGSVEKWQEDFRAAGVAARGWVVLACNLEDGKLHSYSMDLHHVGAVWSSLPLLVLDVYEHAYLLDYGVKRPGYLDAFFKNIDWNVVNQRTERVLAVQQTYTK